MNLFQLLVQNRFQVVTLYNFAMKNKNKEALLNYLNKYKLLGFEYLDTIHFDTQQQNHIDLPKKLDQLQEHISHCNLCELSKNKSLSHHIDLKNSIKDIYIVGLESQYLNADNIDLLKKMVENVLGISINDVFITSVLHCPIQGATKKELLEDHINTCKEYFKHLVKTYKPKIIISLGDSYKYLLQNKDPIEKVSGLEYKYNDTKLIPLYEPSQIIKNPSIKPKVFEDLKKIKTILEKL